MLLNELFKKKYQYRKVSNSSLLREFAYVKKLQKQTWYTCKLIYFHYDKQKKCWNLKLYGMEAQISIKIHVTDCKQYTKRKKMCVKKLKTSVVNVLMVFVFVVYIQMWKMRNKIVWFQALY